MSEPTPHLAIAVDAHDRAIGPAGAPATLVVYGDYECPYTRLAMPVVSALLTHFGERLRFVYRQFPLAKHPHAFVASEAALAADAQGHFWPMHVALFNNQRALEPPDLRRYAADLGLDTAHFEADLDAHGHAGTITAEVEGGRRSGVTGTPTHFINGLRFDGDDSREGLERAIEAVSGPLGDGDR